LVDFRSAMRLALQAALDELRRHVPSAADLSVDALQATRERVAAELGPAARMEAIRAAAFRRTLEELGRPDPELASDLTRLYLDLRFSGLRVYDDVLPTLDALHGRCALGLVSNGNSYPERVSIERYFRFTFFAHDHGVRKPERAFYDALLAVAGCDAGDIVHVGDSLENDVVAAQRVGIRPVWLNRDGRTASDDDAWPQIRTLTELPAVIGLPLVRRTRPAGSK
jgi:FMN hydrolase / 5-amino-6-(5-phospho-D-ribitylamino)uracil phosphatase